MKIKTILMMLWMITLLIPRTVHAAETAYDVFEKARAATHRDGSLQLHGSEVSSIIESNSKTVRRNYQINGYIVNASETFMQFDNPVIRSSSVLPGDSMLSRLSFLLTPSAIFIKTSIQPDEWARQDITVMLPRFIELGTLDQFFMLELLNGDRLPTYRDYMSHGSVREVDGVKCRMVNVDMTRAQFAELAGELTKDVPSLLGDAATGLSEQQLALAKTFTRGIFTNLDAETHYVFYIQQNNGRIVQIDTRMDMANPYGSMPGAESRIQSSGSVKLHDFGGKVSRIVP